MALTAMTLTGLLLAVSSCAGPAAGPMAAPQPPAVSAPPAGLQAASNIPIKGKAHDGKGEYLQTTIAANEPALVFDPETVKEDTGEKFSVADMTEAQRVVVTFIAEETIDSTLNGNPKDPAAIDAWWAKNKDKFVADSDDEYESLSSPDPKQNLVMRGLHRDGKYDLAYGPDKTHVLSRTMTTRNIRATDIVGPGGLSIVVNVEFGLAAVVDGKEVEEKNEAQMGYIMQKDPATGEWLIAAYLGYIKPPMLAT